MLYEKKNLKCVFWNDLSSDLSGLTSYDVVLAIQWLLILREKFWIVASSLVCGIISIVTDHSLPDDAIDQRKPRTGSWELARCYWLRLKFFQKFGTP